MALAGGIAPCLHAADLSACFRPTQPTQPTQRPCVWPRLLRTFLRATSPQDVSTSSLSRMTGVGRQWPAIPTVLGFYGNLGNRGPEARGGTWKMRRETALMGFCWRYTAAARCSLVRQLFA